MLVRDHEKQEIGTFQVAKKFNALAQMVESYAAMMAVTFCQDIRLNQIIIKEMLSK